MTAPRTRVAWLIARTLGLVVLLALALVMSSVHHAELPLAREAARRFIEQAFSSELRGELRIGKLERLDPWAIQASDLVLIDPGGHQVVRATRLDLIVDLEALHAGRIRILNARIPEAEVVLRDAGDGLPTLLTCFESDVPGAPAPSGTDEIVIDGITIENVAVRGDLLGLRGLHAQGLSATGAMRVGEQVRVRITEARTRVIAPFPFAAEIDRIEGSISTELTEGVELSVAAHRVRDDGRTEHASGRVGYRARKPDSEQELSLELDVRELRTDTLQGLGFDFIPELLVPVDGQLELQGPVERLTLEVRAASEAGPAQVNGTISTQEGYRVLIATPGLALARVWPSAPDLEVSGSLELQAKPEEEDPHVTLTLDPLSVDTWPIPALVLRGVLTESALNVEAVEGTHPGSRFEGRGLIGFDGSLALEVDAHIDDVAHDPTFAKVLPEASGRLDADLDIRADDVSQGKLELQGRVNLARFAYGRLNAERLTIDGTVSGVPANPSVRVSVRGKGVALDAYVLGDAQLRVAGGPRTFRTEGQLEREGQRQFHLVASARIEPSAFVLDAESVELLVGEDSWRGMLKNLVLAEDGSVGLELLRLANRSQRLEARAQVQAHGADTGNVLLQDFDLSALHALLGDRVPIREGRADAQVTLDGDISTPVVQAQGALRGGRVGDIADVNAVYFVIYERGDLDLDAEVDLGERGIVRARGTGQVDPTIRDPIEALELAHYSLAVESDNLTLDLVQAACDAGITGRISAALRVTGSLSAPELSGNVRFAPLRLPGLPELDAVVHLDRSGQELRARADVGDERGRLLTGRARVEIGVRDAITDPDALLRVLSDGPWELEIDSVGRRLDTLPAPIGTALPYSATLDLGIDLMKRGGKTSGGGRFVVALAERLQTECAARAKPRISGRFELVDDVSTFELFARLGTSRLASVEASVATPVDAWMRAGAVSPITSYRGRARVDIRNMANVPYLCAQGRGSLTADLEIDGGGSREPLLVAALQSTFVPNVVLEGRRRKVRARGCGKDPLQLVVDLNANGDTFRGRAQMRGCHGGQSSVQGTVPAEWSTLYVLPVPDPKRPLELDVKLARAQLAPLLDRIPGVRNSDVLAQGSLRLFGSLEAMRGEGQVRVEHGQLYLVTTGQQLTDIRASLELRDDWAKVEQLSVKSGSGSLAAQGGLGFEGLWPRRAQLAVSADRFPLQRDALDIATVTGSAALDADMRPERLRAMAKVHKLTVRLPDQDTRALQPLDPHPDVTVDGGGTETGEAPYPVELVVDGRRGIRVRRNDFDATVSSQLAVRYEDPDLYVGGYVDFRQGRFETLGRPFRIERGGLRFDGSTSQNPEVDLIATHRPEVVGASPVTVSVTGTLAKPVVTFSSDACPGDTGAITYMLSGQCVADDPDLAQESEDAQQAFAVGIAGSSVLTLLGPPPRVGGVTPRVGVESGGRGYDTRFKAGVSSESLVPKFMRKLVQRVYVQGAVSTHASEDQTIETQEGPDSLSRALDFLIELYFPHNIVGAGKFSEDNWGLDITWEP